MGRLARNNWVFGAMVLLLAVVIAAGGFVLGQTTDARPTQMDLGKAVHHAAQKASERRVDERFAAERKELPEILRKFGANTVLKEEVADPEAKEALAALREVLLGEVTRIEPRLIHVNKWGKIDRLEGKLMTPQERADVNKGINEAFAAGRLVGGDR